MNILEHPKCIIDMKYVEIIGNIYIYNANFYCFNNGYKQIKLTSLKGCPIITNGTFDCSHNKLKSLKYCPIEIHGNFNCSYNLLESLEHCPKYVSGNFYCRYNKKRFTEPYVRSLCHIEGTVYEYY